MSLSFDDTIDSTQLLPFENPFVRVDKGSATALISVSVAYLDEDDTIDVDQSLGEDDWIEIWSPAVHNLGNLSMEKRMKSMNISETKCISLVMLKLIVMGT